MCSPRRAWPSSARTTVVFPDPDSPTRPSTWPACTANETSPRRSARGPEPTSRSSRRRPSRTSRSLTSSRTPLRDRVGAGHVRRSGASSSISAASSGLRSTPIATRATASVNVFVPMVSTAIRTAGTMTAHGLDGRPIRFSLIIVPQLGAGGGWPKPRKARPGDDHDRVRQPQAGLHHERGDQVGGDLLGHDFDRAHALQFHHLDVLTLRDTQSRRAQHPGDLRGVRDADRHDDEPKPAARRCSPAAGRRQAAERPGTRQRSHDQAVRPSAQIRSRDAGAAPTSTPKAVARPP